MEKNTGSFSLKKGLLFGVGLFLLAGGLIAVMAWRVYGAGDRPNLLANPGFDSALAGWQVASAGQARAEPRPARDDAGNTVLELAIPAEGPGSWVGLGQRLAVVPLQRYRLLADFRLPGADVQPPATLVWRVSQFDPAGQLVAFDEVSTSTLSPDLPGGQTGQGWRSFSHTFVSVEQAATLEVGLGLLGDRVTTVEVDNLDMVVRPTWTGTFRDDLLARAAGVLLLVVAGYAVGRLGRPARRRLAANAGLVVVSLAVTLLAVEIAARFIPVNLISPNWPPGYHIPYLAGKSYRLAENFPATFVTDEAGDRHLVMSNSLGVRDVPVTPETGQDIVLVLGDSMTFGWAISDVQDTWPRRLDEAVDQALGGPSRYHFVNAGVSGYNTFQEVMLLETLLKEMEQAGLKPQVALISFFSRIWERNLYGPEGRFTVFNGVIMYNVVKQALLHLPSRLIQQGRLDELKVIAGSRLDAGHSFLITRSRLYFLLSLMLVNRLDEDWDRLPDEDPVAINTAAFQAFKEVAEANGVQPVVAYLPADNLFSPYKEAENQALVDQLAAICRELDIVFIDPVANMRRLGITGDNAKEKLTLVYNRHYSAQGNDIYARALAPLFAAYLEQLEQPAVSSQKSQ